MTGEKKSAASSRKPRADSERNRRRLLDAATAAFAAVGPSVSLEEIARRAGVGIGTLYRHFPERDALLAEVYRDALRQLADAAPRLAAEHPPVEALRCWLRVFVDFLATKKVIAPALEGMAGGTSELYAGSLTAIRTALSLLVDRGVASGEIRIDIDPLDLLWAVAGVVMPEAGPNRRDTAYQVIDIILAGLKAR